MNTHSTKSNRKHRSKKCTDDPDIDPSKENQTVFPVTLPILESNDRELGEPKDKAEAQIINGWNQQNLDTIKSWRRSISRTSFIYQLVTDKYNTRLSRFLLAAFIINTIISMLAALKVVFNVVVADWVQNLKISFDAITLILATTVMILNGTMKMFDWQTFVTSCSKYIERLESLYAVVAGTLGLPAELRGNAVSFITKTDRMYLDLMRQRPQLRPSDYTWASTNYETFIKNQAHSYELTQKYIGKDIIIDLV